jgi:membrane-associated HD superfamily phosphohydrolase
MKDRSEKNPLFIPALIATLIPFVILVILNIAGGYMNALMIKLLVCLMMVTPFAALILSIAGSVIARKRQKRLIGCAICFIISFLEVLFALCVPTYLSKAKTTPPDYTIVPHTLRSEQIAEKESINEIINGTLKSNTERRT